MIRDAPVVRQNESSPWWGTTIVGMTGWWASAAATDPSRRCSITPCPRDPTTSRSASPLAARSAARGSPGITSNSTAGCVRKSVSSAATLSFQVLTGSGFGDLGRRRQRVTDDRLTRVRPHHGDPRGRAEMGERPLQSVAGMRRSVEPDDDVEPIVDGRQPPGGSTRRARWNVVRSRHRRTRPTDRLGNSIPGSRPRAVLIPRQRRRDLRRPGRRSPVRRRRAMGHAPPGTPADARSRHPGTDLRCSSSPSSAPNPTAYRPLSNAITGSTAPRWSA